MSHTTESEGPISPSRRRFLSRLSIGLSAAVGVVVGAPIVGFLLWPLFRQPPAQWRTVGRITEFQIGSTVERSFDEPSSLPWAGLASTQAIYLRRTTERDFVAFSVNCTHLGCPVRWLESASLFMCPCHGGVYYSDGTVAGGPPPEPLPRYDVRVTANGEVQVLAGPSPLA